MKASAFLLAAACLQAQSGHWEGVIKQEGRDSLFTIDLNNQPDWNGTFLVPGQNAPPLPLSAIAIQGATVQFEIRDLPGNPTFKGKLAEESTSLRGTVTQGTGIAVFEMRRTGDAQIHPIPANSALDPSLLGDWTGTLPQANPIQLILHLTVDEAGLGAGTLDTADHRARNLILSAIRQTGSTLTFDVRIISGSYRGERNADGTRITGNWTQNGATAPLTFEKQK